MSQRRENLNFIIKVLRNQNSRNWFSMADKGKLLALYASAFTIFCLKAFFFNKMHQEPCKCWDPMVFLPIHRKGKKS